MRYGLRMAAGCAAVVAALIVAGCGNPETASNVTPSAVTSTVTSTATATAAPTTVTVTDTATATPTSAARTPGGPCAITDLGVTLGAPEGAAGSSYSALTFTNTSFTSCTVSGFPTVAYVTGADSTQVGAVAAQDGAKGAAVTLKPGQSAAAQLQQVTVQNFPEDVCKLTDVTGLKVSLPGADGAVFVPQADRQGCAATELPGGQFQMSVQALAAAK